MIIAKTLVSIYKSVFREFDVRKYFLSYFDELAKQNMTWSSALAIQGIALGNVLCGFDLQIWRNFTQFFKFLLIIVGQAKILNALVSIELITFFSFTRFPSSFLS